MKYEDTDTLGQPGGMKSRQLSWFKKDRPRHCNDHPNILGGNSQNKSILHDLLDLCGVKCQVSSVFELSNQTWSHKILFVIAFVYFTPLSFHPYTMPSGTNDQGNHYNTPGGTNSSQGGSYHCEFALL